jgi:succinyl-CoA synthetase beta subunit
MRLLEYQGKELLAEFGIPTAKGAAASDADEAAAVAGALGYPVVVKAQVLTGGRGKAGGIRLAKDESALRETATAILGMTIKGERCGLLLIVKAVAIARELYAGVSIDSSAGRPVLLFSTAGGMDIESVARETPDKVRSFPFSPLRPPRRHEILEELRLGGVTGGLLPKVATIVQQLIAAFLARDCTTLEINPLAVTPEGDCLALDAKAVIDDAALRRQGMARTDGAAVTDLEKRAAAIGVNYVALGKGCVAVIAGGAGLGMASMDIVNGSGLGAASFLDTGGGISSANTAEALRISLATPGVKGVLINIFGGINNCRDIAQGVAEVMDTDKPGAEVVIKMRGHAQDEGWALLEARNLPLVKHGTSEEAVRLLAARLKG